ncbi:MAG: 4-hydroxythreonine-4-phosphate dehydrogenase PdxA [Prevotella sp.]|nr:4-hydroxythreonine-4-phosphate dehydrogenase PdxA [Prevotella sp.]
MENEKIRVAITHGDTNGIGYEVIFKAFEDPMMLELCTPIIYGSPRAAAYHRKALEMELNVNIINTAEEAEEGKLNLLTTFEEEVKIELGKPSPEAGTAALTALERAMADFKENQYDVLVTAPINKNNIQSDAFRFCGHTEYIEEKVGDGAKSLMILMSGNLRVALVTTHLAVKDIAAAITTEKIVEKATILHDSLKRDFRITNPRIAVLSLNPHVGDNGLLGTEEQEMIIPAINILEENNIQAFGPYAADGFFGSGTYTKFDAVLAMYHDQGLAPFKALASESGVNYTAGLPIVRTSPDHGTAYDIAGKNKADHNSLRHAIYTAIDVYRNRSNYDEATANPLKKLYHERREDGDKARFAQKPRDFKRDNKQEQTTPTEQQDNAPQAEE